MPHSQSPTLITWSVRLLAIAACGMSVHLLYASLTMVPVAGCDWDFFDCNAALASPWAKWFGLPVAAAGLACYSITFIATWLVNAKSLGSNDAGWRLLELLVPAMIGAGVWFVGVQAVMLDSFCLYCMLIHLCGIVIALLLIALRRSRETTSASALIAVGSIGINNPGNILPSGPPSLGLPTVVGLFSVLVLIGGQLIASGSSTPLQSTVQADALPEDLRFDEPLSRTNTDLRVLEEDSSTKAKEIRPTVSPSAVSRSAAPRRKKNGSRIASFLDGRLKIDTYDVPVLGSPEAPHIVMELMDYACPHCRDFHEVLVEAIDRFDGQIAVVVMPVPSEILCNPYIRQSRPKSRGACRIAKVALAMAAVAPESFEEVHHWLLQEERMPQFTSALIEAQRYADNDKLSFAVRDAGGEIDARIKQNIQLMATLRKIGQVGLPTQVLSDRVVSGPSESIDSLCKLWTEVYKIQPKESVSQVTE